MKSEDKKQLIALYEDRYAQYGYDVKTIGWGDIRTQLLRFDILCDIADLRGRSVCDLGCGFGDLSPYLLKRFGQVEYFGLDISTKLIAKAKEKYPEVSFAVCDILEDDVGRKFDFVLCSGALSFKIDDNDKHIYQMLRRMMEITKIGVAVNFLSTYVDYHLEKNFHFAPERALSLGKEITRFVTLRHDYPLYEFTLYLYHESNPPNGN